MFQQISKSHWTYNSSKRYHSIDHTKTDYRFKLYMIIVFVCIDRCCSAQKNCEADIKRWNTNDWHDSNEVPDFIRGKWGLLWWNIASTISCLRGIAILFYYRLIDWLHFHLKDWFELFSSTSILCQHLSN